MAMLSSKFNFGQYINIEIGFIFLFDPSYINWLLCDTDRIVFSNLQDLEALKTFYFEKLPVPPYFNSGEKQVVALEYSEGYSFSMLSNSGVQTFNFSSRANERNSYLLNQADYFNSPILVPNRKCFYQIPTIIDIYFNDFNISQFKCTFNEVKIEKQNNFEKAFAVFTLDNSNHQVSSYLLPIKSCKISFELTDIYQAYLIPAGNNLANFEVEPEQELSMRVRNGKFEIIR